jgi:hypothetical protein
MSMDDYSIDQLMLFIGGVASSVVLILLACQKSKCEEIGCCGCKIKRNVEAIIQEQKIKRGIPSTPRRSERIKEKELDLTPEPEPEPEPEP